MTAKTGGRLGQIRSHFEKEAEAFDRVFFKIMPSYRRMIEAAVEAVPFQKGKALRALDLGCGTGNLAEALIKAYPGSSVTCLDMAENMIRMARAKLGKKRGVSFWQGDIRKFDYSGRYDAILASMVLHHIEKKEKTAFYRRLRNTLSRNGVFNVIDIFVSPDRLIQEFYVREWKSFMLNNGIKRAQVENMLCRHRREDRPVSLSEELAMLRRAGFARAEVIIKEYNFAAISARR
ncbi:MAG: class I SAM-dependent methyltransferase [Candidatus Omnitrophica bacterium]|jgi:tRNA (cmo5U34)-methyltransferase|nr:class I SAM-dependent methyltransferase [Candidatus Omnitrophota bacterium]MDD3274680.1 class I SAM-dependent methyltransferase [Candidatus Omnitrophota bacterium]MDD5077614.1 class I SAM-dependent methyltransferase [Candidatus Omnitrophota bacterium]MDD5725389.1 class I SAM-dependent methyltransferase [Candidatus Omnitrophota bacterium]